MRLLSALLVGVGLLAALAPSADAAGNRWTRKKDKEEEANGFDTLIKLKKPDGRKAPPAGVASTGSGAGAMARGAIPAGNAPSLNDFMKTMQAGMSEEGFDMQKMISESIDLMVTMLTDPEQRKLFNRESIEAMLLQMPADAQQSPEMADGLRKSLAQLEEMDPQEYQVKVDEILDGMLEYAKGMQDMLRDPDALNKVMTETLNSMGLSEKDIQEAQKLLSDPKAMQEAFAALGELGDLGLGDADLAELKKLMGDSSGGMPDLDKMLAGLMEDPAMAAALKDPSSMAGLYDDLLQDPELQAALGNAKDSVKTQRKR